MIYLIIPSYVCDIENHTIFTQMVSTFSSFTRDVKVIGIDNGSIDQSKLLLKKVSNIYCEFETPLGYARAVNIGWKITEELPDCEYVGVLNNDLTFTQGWLDALIKNLDEKTAACASYDSPVEANLISDHIWSSCFLMQHDTRKKIGYFDATSLPYRYHDQDYWIRAKNLGLSFKRVGASRVGHKESTTYKKMPQRTHESHEQTIMRLRWGVDMAQYYVPEHS